MRLVDRGGYFVAENAVVLGDVRFGEGASVWYGAVLRGDMAPIRIGRMTNVQDLCVLHCDPGEELTIGTAVTIGHQALIHGRSIGDFCLVGMQCAILAGAEIGEGCVIGAGAVVREGQNIPPYSVAVGVPAKVISDVPREKKKEFEERALRYHETALRHVRGELRAPWGK